MAEVLKLNKLFFEAYELRLQVISDQKKCYEETESHFERATEKGFGEGSGRIYSDYESFIQAYYRYKNK